MRYAQLGRVDGDVHAQRGGARAPLSSSGDTRVDSGLRLSTVKTGIVFSPLGLGAFPVGGVFGDVDVRWRG